LKRRDKEIIAIIITLMKENNCSPQETVANHLGEMMAIVKHDYDQFVEDRANEIEYVYEQIYN
jgi:phosphoenolpyruvate-protein kinase (PTS system EI component)